MAVERPRNRNQRPPLDPAALEQLALRYVGRYATTRAKLAAYLSRKVRDRGWAGAVAPDVEAVAAKMAGLGYVDDRGFAAARAAALGRRGYGERRVREALRAAGIGDEDSAAAREQAQRNGWEAALRLAQRRGIGPYAAEEPGREGRDRAFGILLRAGHPPDLAHRVAHARPGEIPDADGS
jgi:regulatory protein